MIGAETILKISAVIVNALATKPTRVAGAPMELTYLGMMVDIIWTTICMRQPAIKTLTNVGFQILEGPSWTFTASFPMGRPLIAADAVHVAEHGAQTIQRSCRKGRGTDSGGVGAQVVGAAGAGQDDM